MVIPKLVSAAMNTFHTAKADVYKPRLLATQKEHNVLWNRFTAASKAVLTTTIDAAETSSASGEAYVYTGSLNLLNEGYASMFLAHFREKGYRWNSSQFTFCHPNHMPIWFKMESPEN